MRVPYFGGPYIIIIKDPTIRGNILGSPIFGFGNPPYMSPDFITLIELLCSPSSKALLQKCQNPDRQ